MTGYSWGCPCGAWDDGYPDEPTRDAALKKHAKRCRAVPSGHELRSVSTGRLIWRKP